MNERVDIYIRETAGLENMERKKKAMFTTSREEGGCFGSGGGAVFWDRGQLNVASLTVRRVWDQ